MNGEETEKKSWEKKIARFLPTVEKPTYKQPLNTRLKWTAFALVMYFILSFVTVYGVQRTAYEQFRFFEIVLGSRFGSLMTLGIGPIVTAGIVLQLLVGSKILNWDMSKPEGRKKFQTWDKFIAIILCFVEGFAFVFAGALPVQPGQFTLVFVILQLALGGIIVIFLDELVSKWGVGSGISLFIAAGVGSQILIRALSPFPTTCFPGNIASCIPSATNQPTGLIWQFMINSISGQIYFAMLALLPMAVTAIVFFIAAYAQDIRIDIPLAFSSMRGFGRTWSLKMLYTSNIPVILAAALIANLQLMGRIGAVPTAGLDCSVLACYDQQGQVVSGLVYYLSAPNNLLGDIIQGTLIPSEVIRALTYLLFLTATATIFSVFWVNTAGMDSGSVSKQIAGIGMHIPGYRSDQKSIETVLNKYIPALALLGGIAVGLIAALADFTGAIGTGTGILLTVMVIYNYYEQLSAEKTEEAHPIVRRILGE